MAIVINAGSAYTLQFSLGSQAAAGTWQVNPTLAAGDFQRSINGGAFANTDNLPTVTPAGGTRVALTISAAETTAAGDGGMIYVVGQDAAGAEWYSIGFDIHVRDLTFDVASLDDNVEGGYSLRELTRLMAAALCGQSTGGATTTIRFRDVNDTTTRIVATVNERGDRLAVALNEV